MAQQTINVDTAVTVTDGVTATGDVMISAYTGDITVAADAMLIGIRIKYTINAGDDS